jgi:hypothetical protein
MAWLVHLGCVCCRQRGVAQQYVLPTYFAYACVSVRMQFRTDVLRSGPSLRSALLRSLQHSAVGNYTCTGRGSTGSERTVLQQHCPSVEAGNCELNSLNCLNVCCTREGTVYCILYSILYGGARWHSG